MFVDVDWSAGYREQQAPPHLQVGVSSIWIRVMPSSPGPPVEVWPDAGVDVIWQQGRPALVAGPDTGPMPATIESGAVLVGARFRPGAAGPALGLPMHELRDRRIALSEIRADLDRKLSSDLTPDMAVGRVVEIVGEMVAAEPPDPLVRHAATRLADPAESLDDLMEQGDVSGRQLRRRFVQALGYGPKVLERVLRFQRFVKLLETTPVANLATAAVDLGYADQAHMTRECRRLSGKTPRELRDERRPNRLNKRVFTK
jgi:AraC-like DNA-binding protein